MSKSIVVIHVDGYSPSMEETLVAAKASAKGMDLVTKVIDPEIQKFEEWFQVPQRGNGPFTRLERELLRSYLYQKLTGVL